MNRSLHVSMVFSVLMCTLLLVDASVAQTQDRFAISGQIRQRTEYSAKDFNADVSNPLYTFLRTRLNVGVNPTDDVKAFVQYQETRTLGGENAAKARCTMDGNAPLFDVHQAYFSVSNVFDTKLSAKIGRQEINIGNQRLVGAVGWHNVGRTFDAARFGFQAESASFDFFAARLIGNTGNTDGDNLFGIVGALPVNEDSRFEALILMDNKTNAVVGGVDDGENMLQRFTLGATWSGSSSKFDYELEGYYQMGDQFEAATGKLGSIAASLASGKIGYLVSEERGIKLGALFTLVSGDDDPADGDIKNFDTLFATNHKFYGFMDYFVGAGSFARGLQDVAATVTMKTNDKTSLALAVHHFTSPQAFSGVDGTLGQEIDFTLNYAYNKAMSIVGGVSAFVPGDDFGGKDTGFWAYLSTIVNF